MSRHPAYWIEVPPNHPDAALIALCNQVCTTHGRERRQTAQIDHLDGVERAAAWSRFDAGKADWHGLNAQIRALRATTPKGTRAKAEILALVIALDEPNVASLVLNIVRRPIAGLPREDRRQIRPTMAYSQTLRAGLYLGPGPPSTGPYSPLRQLIELRVKHVSSSRLAANVRASDNRREMEHEICP